MRTRLFIAVLIFASFLAACGGRGAVPATGTAGLAPQRASLLPGAGSPRIVLVPDSAHRRFVKSVRAGRVHFFATRPHENRAASSATPTPTPAPNLTYHGGPVQTAPGIAILFWGFDFGTRPPFTDATHDPDGVANLVYDFYTALDCSPWIDTLTQYYQTGNAYIAEPCTDLVTAVYVDPSPPPASYTISDVGSEAFNVANLNGALDPNTNVVVVTPTGYAQSGFGTTFCAYHSYEYSGSTMQPFTLVPYIPDAGEPCGVGAVTSPGTLDGVTINAGHEEAETQSDPFVDAWFDTSETAPYCSGTDASTLCEVADKCAWQGLALTPMNGTAFPTQPLWSNASNGCVQGTAPSPSPSPTPTATPLGPVVVTPHALKFILVLSHEKTVRVSQANYTGAFTHTGDCRGVALIRSSENGLGKAVYDVMPRKPGTCSVTFAGGSPGGTTMKITITR